MSNLDRLKTFKELDGKNNAVNMWDWVRCLTDYVINERQDLDNHAKNMYLMGVEQGLEKGKQVANTRKNAAAGVTIGSVWRCLKSGKLCQVAGITDLGEPLITFDSKSAGKVEDFPQGYELATMENLQEGNWIECLSEEWDDCTKGSIYEVVMISNLEPYEALFKDNVGVVRFLCDGSLSDFKPCLPPAKKGIVIEGSRHECREGVKAGQFTDRKTHDDDKLHHKNIVMYTHKEVEKVMSLAERARYKQGYEDGFRIAKRYIKSRV